jgi:DNA-binding XRE family transcriptional regulator
MARTLKDLLEKQDPEMVQRARDRASAILLDLRLAELRDYAEMTQVEMAKALGIKQPTVANIEKPGRDLKLSSLKRYVEALGGKLRIDVEFDDGRHYGVNL